MQTTKGKAVTRIRDKDEERELLLGKREPRQEDVNDEVTYEKVNQELTFEYAQHVFQHVEELEWLKESVNAQKDTHREMSNAVELQKTYIKRFKEWVAKLPLAVDDIKQKFDEFLEQLGPGLEAIKARIIDSLEKVEETEDRIEKMIGEGEERKRICRQAEYTKRAMGGFKAKFSILAATLKMNSMYTAFPENDRIDLKSVFGQFKNLYYNLIEFIETLKSSKAYICIDCWTIILLRQTQLKSKWFKRANIKLMRDYLTRKDEPSIGKQCEDFYEGLEITDEVMEEKPIIKQVPSICLPGDRANERTGHDCQRKLKEQRVEKALDEKSKKKRRQSEVDDNDESTLNNEGDQPEIRFESSHSQERQVKTARRLMRQAKLVSVTLKTGRKLLPHEIAHIEFVFDEKEADMNDSENHSENE